MHYASLTWGLSVCIPALALWPVPTEEPLHVLLFYPWRLLLYIEYGITQIGIVIATMTIFIVRPQYLMIRLVLRRASARLDTISSICFNI